MPIVKFSVEELDRLLDIHARAEFALDYDATMDSVVDDPMYELHPQGLRINGRSAVREMYQRILPVYMANVRRPELRVKAYGDNSVIAEYKFAIRQPDGGWLSAYRMGIVEFAEDGRVYSERDYQSPAMADMMTSALGEDFYDVPGVERV